jgi:hypothetical protein
MKDKATLAQRSIDVSKERLVSIERNKLNLDFDNSLRHHDGPTSVPRAGRKRNAHRNWMPHHSFE